MGWTEKCGPSRSLTRNMPCLSRENTVLLQKGDKPSSVCSTEQGQRISLEQTKIHYTHCGGGECTSILFISSTVNCLIVPRHPVAPNLRLHSPACACADVLCVCISVSARQNHTFVTHSISRCKWDKCLCPDHPTRKHRGSKSMSSHEARRVKGEVWCWTALVKVYLFLGETEHLAATRHIR